MLAWPSTLLPDLLTNFNGAMAPSGAVLRSDDSTTGGLPYQVERFDDSFPTENAQWMMTDFQYAFFQSFFRYQINGGADWFTLDITEGGGLRNQPVRFTGGNYKATFQDTSMWLVTASLDLQTPALMTEAALNTYLNEPSYPQALAAATSAGDATTMGAFRN